MKTVLISGASIAGPTLAYWLAKNGYRPTLIERAPAPRPGGQAIDIRGAALTVADRMGILEDARRQRTQMKGMSVIDADGTEVWRSEERTFTGGKFDAGDVEILRDDLAALLLDRARPGTELIYGDSITGLRDDDDGIVAEFEHAAARRFDLVIGADGIHSRVRKLTFGAESQFLFPLGVALAVYSAPNTLDLKDWQIAHQDETSGFILYTARENTQLRVGLGFAAGLEQEHRGDLQAQMTLVAERSSHFRWKIPELLKAMWSAPDFYLGVMAQVRMDNWSKGRVALIGDAGYCPTPFSGQGTSLAMVGAYVLAQELGRTPDDHAAAFAGTEQKMRPYVLKNQALATLDRSSDRSLLDAALENAKNAIDLASV